MQNTAFKKSSLDTPKKTIHCLTIYIFCCIKSRGLQHRTVVWKCKLEIFVHKLSPNWPRAGNSSGSISDARIISCLDLWLFGKVKVIYKHYQSNFQCTGVLSLYRYRSLSSRAPAASRPPGCSACPSGPIECCTMAAFLRNGLSWRWIQNSKICQLDFKIFFSLAKTSSSGVDSGGAGGARAPPEFGGSEKGAKPDFCSSEFSYYYEHPWI